MVARHIRIVSVLCIAVLVFAGCQSKSSSTSTETASSTNATAESNKQAVEAFMAGMARGDTTVVDSFVAENLVEHQQMPGMASGPAGLKAMIAQWHEAFPDLQMTVNDISADSNKVWVYSTMSGTMKGPLMGMKPTGRTFHMDGFDLVRMENGKAVEHWGESDNMAMMQQLGLSMPSGAKQGGTKHP